MPAHVGRDAVLNKNSVALAGIRVTTLTYAGETVDITDRGDAGLRVLSDDMGVESVDFSVEGVWKDATIRAIAMGSGSKKLTDVTLDFVDGAEWSGDVVLSGYTEGMPHNGEATWTMTLMSSGPWTYTP